MVGVEPRQRAGQPDCYDYPNRGRDPGILVCAGDDPHLFLEPRLVAFCRLARTFVYHLASHHSCSKTHLVFHPPDPRDDDRSDAEGLHPSCSGERVVRISHYLASRPAQFLDPGSYAHFLMVGRTAGRLSDCEVIFAVPGIGRVLYDAVIANDLPVVQAGVVLITALAIVINTLTDLSYIVLNPAIRLSNSSR